MAASGAVWTTSRAERRWESGMSEEGTVLVIDDEEVMREILESLLTQEGYRVKLATSGQEGLEIAGRAPGDLAIVDGMAPGRGRVDLGIVDVMLPDRSGIDVLDELKKSDPELVVVMITAFASVETAIEAMKRGALDYVTKPFKNDEVRVVVANGMTQQRGL